MRITCVPVVAALFVSAISGGTADAGWPWHAARCQTGATPFAGTGCGPRVYGPCHEPVGPIDQCDACARFSGCEGYRQQPEMLPPWQLPPGRGFQPPEALGYRPGTCAACAAHAPRGPGRSAW